MSTSQTVVPDEVVGFLLETLPNLAATPEWRMLFDLLSDLNVSQRERMLKLVDSDPLFEGEETFKKFMRLSIVEPENPQMMVRMIDFYSDNVEGERFECNR